MKTWLLIVCVVLGGACAAQAPGDEAADWDGVPAVESATQSLQLSQPISIEELPTATPLIPANGPDVELGKNKCTPERQDACNACADACTVCDRNNGGGQAGGCVGLFCPTKCDVCVLSCYKTCGKCLPAGY